MDLIYTEMKNDGWRVVEKKSNFGRLCFDENLVLTILFPVKTTAYGETNEGVVFDNMDVWNIFYYYSGSTKITDCNLSPEIIDFNSLE